MISSTPRAWTAVCGIVLTLAACEATGGVLSTEIPPTEPTHHALVEGVVRDAAGAPLHAIGVGVRFAGSSPPSRQVSVTGGTTTESDGSYRLVVNATRLPTVGIADFYVHALVYAPPGGRLRQDSVLMSARFVPRDHVPLRVTAPDLRLPPP